MIKAVLFDLDGTLLDTNELIYKSFDYTFKEGLGLTLSKNEITSYFGQPLPYTFKMFTKDEEKIEKIYYTKNFNVSRNFSWFKNSINKDETWIRNDGKFV